MKLSLKRFLFNHLFPSFLDVNYINLDIYLFCLHIKSLKNYEMNLNIYLNMIDMPFNKWTLLF
jgi:hypothetical protein